MNTEQILRDQLEREREVIHAMQRRQSRWLGPVGDLLWRKPWRSPTKPDASWQIASIWLWLRAAHDCADPSIGCSCQGGFRFPGQPPS